ncbi:MAG: hypothetical protein SGJ19_18645 [Planctomycetia bacterium]|nr:hypothetical protein [Planctomycetia bacterium]
MKRTGMMFLVALAVSAPAASAVAQGCGWGGYYGGYSLYSRESIPYYAQNPPVYYSYPVPRTYGWSPYAYPPGTMTPELDLPVAPAPTTYRNPFYKPEGKTESTASTETQGSTAALRIINPFIADAADRPAAKLAKVVTTK